MFLLSDDSKVTPDEFRQGWVGTFNLGGPDDANNLFTRLDFTDDGLLDIRDITQLFAYFDENGTLFLKAHTLSDFYLSRSLFPF